MQLPATATGTLLRILAKWMELSQVLSWRPPTSSCFKKHNLRRRRSNHHFTGDGNRVTPMSPRGYAIWPRNVTKDPKALSHTGQFKEILLTHNMHNWFVLSQNSVTSCPQLFKKRFGSVRKSERPPANLLECAKGTDIDLGKSYQSFIYRQD